MERKDYEKMIVDKIDEIDNLDELKESLKVNFLYNLEIGECEQDFKDVIDDMYSIIHFDVIDYYKIIKDKINKINDLGKLQKIAFESFKYQFKKANQANSFEEDVYTEVIFSNLNELKTSKEERIKLLQNNILEIYECMFYDNHIIDYDNIFNTFNKILEQ